MCPKSWIKVGGTPVEVQLMTRSVRLSGVLLVLGLATLPLRVVLPVAAADPCGPGLAAPVADGAAACVHGTDEAPPGADTTDLPTTDELWEARFGEEAPVVAAGEVAMAPVPSAARRVACIGDGTSGPRVQVVYARASDHPGRYDAVLPLLRQYAADADDLINASAGRAGQGRRVRFVTGPDCQVDVARVELSPAGDDTFVDTRDELRARGLASPDRKYLVFVDAAVGICGLGEVFGDDRPGAHNANNGGRAMYSRVDTRCWPHAVTHELLHTLGAVQDSAPHSNGAGHCTDERDVMCYVDGTGTATSLLCPAASEHQVDCGHDDYFDPAPSAGSYLATKWNTASSRFLQVVDSPPPPPRLSVAVPGKFLAGARTRIRAAVELPAGRRAGLVWSSTRDDCRFADARAATTTWTCPVTVAGQAEITARVTDSAGLTASMSRSVSFDVPDRPRATTLTLQVPHDVRDGRRAVVSGVLRDARSDAPIAGMPVTVWGLKAGARQWHEVTTRATSHGGRIKVRVQPSRNVTYTLRSGSTLTWATGASGDRLLRHRPVVTAHAADTTVRRGAAAVARGEVRPARAGAVVRLERRSGGGWRTVTTDRLNSRDRFTLRWHPRTRGTDDYRVVIPGDDRHGTGRSERLTVTVG